MCTCLYISYILKNNNFLFPFLKTLINVGFQDILENLSEPNQDIRYFWNFSLNMLYLPVEMEYTRVHNQYTVSNKQSVHNQ